MTATKLTSTKRAEIIQKVVEYVTATNYSQATKRLNAEHISTLGSGKQWYVIQTRAVFLRHSGAAGQKVAAKLARKPTAEYQAKLDAEADAAAFAAAEAPAKPKAPKAAPRKGV